MWDKLVRYLGMFPSAVLSGIDRAGYPFSVRCSPQPDARRQVVRIRPALDDSIQPGPADLLCHSHNDQMWDLKAFQVFGRLEMNESEWIFTPERLATSGSLASPLDQVRFIWHARAEAARYLSKRGLARPQVPWAQIKALRKEANDL